MCDIGTYILNVTPAAATGARIAKTWPNASIFNTKKREKRWTSSHREKALAVITPRGIGEGRVRLLLMHFGKYKIPARGMSRTDLNGK